MAFLQQQHLMAEPQPTPTPQASSTPEPQSAFFSQRSRRQLGLFAAGAGFFALSTAITRRSIVRRYKATIPKFYQPSNRINYEVNGTMEAFEALNIATINVVSVGMMAAGGLLWAFDIASVDDMRRKVRTNLGVDTNRTDQDAEKEIEEWFASVLARKEFKALRGEKGIKDVEKKDEKKS
jgi:hypothetical protein